MSPRARGECVGGASTDANGQQRLTVRVSAPAQDGKANKALCSAVATALGLPKSAVAVTAGEKSRLKTLTIKTPDARGARARIEDLMKVTS